MLKITKATDPIVVNTITVCVYSPPGIGKTSTGYTADRPLLVDFDKGSHRSKNRRDSVQVENWDDVLAITADDLKPYRTVVVDTAGRALDVLTPWIIKNNAKHGRGGALTLQGYGELKTQFIAWTKFIRSFGLDVVLLSHSDETKNGDEMIERLDIQGGSKNEIYKSADVMGRLFLNGQKRWLNFSPTDTTFGKNPAGLAPIEVPDFKDAPDFLAGVITKIKGHLNELSAEQTEVAGLLADWKTKADAAETVEHFNALLPEYKKVDARVKDNAWRVLVKAAKGKALKFDKDHGFVPEVAPASANGSNGNGAAKPANGTTGAAAATAEKPAEKPADPPAPAAEATPAVEPKKGKSKKAEQESLPVAEAREPGAEG